MRHTHPHTLTPLGNQESRRVRRRDQKTGAERDKTESRWSEAVVSLVVDRR
ncbi:hypothetical protein HanXRQr2_Chr17g0816691 [Helianthus annuus]|uniref:Uncharacterized protein n=1 Tax=Helianthus annuus TaxID=4232 RepID=A0A9K3DM62_HELAN|nr:hypothetical protein HanXRQr2_Chr17g0816691 [Helianthus annuus]